MGRQEKLAERHVFHRLKLRARRQRDGTTPLSAANWLYDVLSGCGWRFGRALAWWIGHIAVGAVILADGWPAVPNSLAVSLANSLGFLRLGSWGGHLHDAQYALEKASSHPDWVFAVIGTVQTILGPILLFLVLLTLRNRFRIG